MTDRIGALIGGKRTDEEDAIEKLAQLARIHGAESRAADIVAESVLIGQFRFCPGLGWVCWTTLPEGGGLWDPDDTAEPRVIEVVRQFADRTERDYRVAATFAKGTADRIAKEVLDKFVAKQVAEGADEKTVRETEKVLGDLVDARGTDEEKASYNEALSGHHDAKRQADMWLNLLSAGKLSSITKLCRGMDGILTRTTEFDSHPDVLNCRNGTVDLRTGKLLPPDPDLLLSHMAGAIYDPAATSPVWAKALEAVPTIAATAGETDDQRRERERNDLQFWFQGRVGQSASGHTPEDDVLIVAAGDGENGKSACMLGLMRALGTYARLISHRVLTASPGQHPTELMDLRGLRMAILEETPEEGRLDTHRVKTTIGTPKITARSMRKDDVTFDTSHTTWINTNFLPQVETTDHGTWRRLKSMPWPYRFRKPGQPMETEFDRPGDLNLKHRLQHDEDVPAAILAWVVAGAGRWYAADRISPPDPDLVIEATNNWRHSSDIGFRFAMERLTSDPDSFITAECMRAQFLGMLESEGKVAWTKPTINNRLGSSMLAARIMCSATPKIPCKLPVGAKESRPGDGDNTTGVSEFGLGGKTTPEPGKAYRVWRGVRWKTRAERDAGHLTVVPRPRAAGAEDGGW